MRKDPAEQLQQAKSYRDTDDRWVEECVNKAVEAILEDADIIQASRYEYQSIGGDLDGMVVGKWMGKEVVVLVEVKHNMDSNATKAKNELFAAEKYWVQLTQLVPGPNTDDLLLGDYRELQVGRYKEHSIIFAFGGSKFSPEAVSKHFGGVATPWFRVVVNSAGKFVAEYQEKK